MQKYTLLLLLCFAGVAGSAQLPFNAVDSIDANRINALVAVHGDMWWNPQTQIAHCQFPANSKKNVGFAAALWMSAYDNAGKLHVAAQTYRQDGNDYWPGPLDASGSLNYATSSSWAKVWKVRRTDIDAYLAITGHTTTNTPASILSWPAKGNAYATGKDGIPLTVTEDMAPFVDINGDGNYQPLDGDYPAIKGDQSLWWVFSDNGPVHTQTNGRPLGVQVHAMTYAYKRNTLMDYVVYQEYTAINKSGNDYHDMRMALWDDADLGYYLDDFVGFDSAKRMAINYNGTNDDGGSAGHPVNSYGINLPAKGVTIVSMPGDGSGGYEPVGSFMYYNNDPSASGNPVTDSAFSFLMRSRWANGSALKNTDPGIFPSRCRRSNAERRYILPDDPSVDTGWNECTCANNPGDRRYILATNDFALKAGAKTRLVLALVVDSASGGCPALANFDGLRRMADTAWGFWQAQHVALDEITSNAHRITVHPNPANSTLYVTTPQNGDISIYNTLGQRVYAAPCKAGSTDVDVSSYAPGVYVLLYNSGGRMESVRFVRR